MISYIVIILLGCALDVIISTFFPVSFSLSNIYAISHCSFIILILISKNADFKTSILLGLLLGFLEDIYGNTSFLIYTSINVTLVLIATFWKNTISDSLFEQLLYCITLVFVREIVTYSLMRIVTNLQMTIIQFVTYRIFATLLLNILLFFACYFIYEFANELAENRDIMKRKNEKALWVNMHMKEEKRH